LENGFTRGAFYASADCIEIEVPIIVDIDPEQAHVFESFGSA
jgi:hypothetical protein